MPAEMLASEGAQLVLPEYLEELVLLVRNTIGAVSWILGGLFGLYIILLVIKWRQNKKIIHLLRDIRHNLLQLNKKLKVKDAFAAAKVQERTFLQRVKTNLNKFVGFCRKRSHKNRAR